MDADENANTRGGDFGSNGHGHMDGGTQADGSYAPFPTDIKSFFGGSFFSQLDIESYNELMELLPRVRSMNDDTLMAELDNISNEFCELDSECDLDGEDALIDFVRTLAHLHGD